VHGFLAKCPTKFEALEIATLHQIGSNFSVKLGLIRRFKLVIKCSPLSKLELGVGAKASELSVGGCSHSHLISHSNPRLLLPLYVWIESSVIFEASWLLL